VATPLHPAPEPSGPCRATSSADQAFYLAFRDHQAGRLQSAVEWYRRATTLRPNFAEALNNLGIALKDLHRPEEAVIAYRKALELRPNLAEIWNNLGDALHRLGELDAAIRHYRRAVEILSDYGIAWRNLGDALAESGALDEAAECFERAVICDPQLDAALAPAEIVLRETKRRFARAVGEIEGACARDPLFAHAYQDCGAGRAAPNGCSAGLTQRYADAEKSRANYHDHLSALLLALHYDPAASREWLHKAHGEAGRAFADLPRCRLTGRSPTVGRRRLRVGYVSADFRTHSVGYFLSPVFAAHDREVVEICCYSGCTDEDEQTSVFKAQSQLWRSTVGTSDAEVANMIRDDGIDILVDLSGHTNGHRLRAFARRPAPIQLTWLGYPDTTGLPSIDYRLTDDTVDPPGAADALSYERLWRLPRGFNCYAAPKEAPPVAASPALINGFVTFGSFNNLAKVNAFVLDLWCDVLKRVPRSQLVLKAKWLAHREMRERLFEQLGQRGLARDRVKLIGKLPSTAAHLAAYANVDIALDTYPYNGATTTCEALWMGVPVVTLAGDRHSSRVGASLLKRVGLSRQVATRPEDYVAAAVALAADIPRLAALRAGGRRRMASSQLCDGAAFTRRLESAYRAMWESQTQGVASPGSGAAMQAEAGNATR